MAEHPRFPLADRPGFALDPEYLEYFREGPLMPVVLASGHQALLVTRHAEVRAVLADQRFSREAWGNGTLFARDSETLALATSDAPTHTRRRRAVQAWFTGRRAEEARPKIEAVAERLLDELVAAGPPADLISRFTTPFPYRVISDVLGLPVADLEVLLPWVSAMMSAGHFSAAEIAAARTGMRSYFSEQVALRKRAISARSPGADLLTALLTAPIDSRLSDEEIEIFGAGLLMAGGETTSNHLAACVQEILARPGLADALRRDPARIPAAIEELLRWVWFMGTGGHPHVALEDVDLGGTVIRRGQVVIPLTDAANRDASEFGDPDDFRPDRAVNPHLAFGHGRHMCLGAPHARLELQVGLAAVLRRLDHLELAVSPDDLPWRTRMFIRGVWSLPVSWSAKSGIE